MATVPVAHVRFRANRVVSTAESSITDLAGSWNPRLCGWTGVARYLNESVVVRMMVICRWRGLSFCSALLLCGHGIGL